MRPSFHRWVNQHGHSPVLVRALPLALCTGFRTCADAVCFSEHCIVAVRLLPIICASRASEACLEYFSYQLQGTSGVSPHPLNVVEVLGDFHLVPLPPRRPCEAAPAPWHT